MQIDYVASKLQQLLNLHKQEPIELVSCDAEDFEELWDEAKSLDLIDCSDEYWFTLKDTSFSIHLVQG